MNKEIMKQAGFGKQVEMVEQKKCPFCGAEIHGREDFKDELSWREYHISGLCQKCQDKIW